MAKTTTETLVRHHPEYGFDATVTLIIKRSQGKVISVKCIDTRPRGSNEGYIYRRSWKRYGALAEALRDIKAFRRQIK